MGLHLRFSSEALTATSALVLRTYEIGRLLDAAEPCMQGAMLSSGNGAVLGATVSCATVTEPGIHGTLRDETGVIAIDGDTPATISVRRLSGGRRAFESEGDLVGFGGAGALVAWRWWMPAESLRAMPGLEGTNHPALVLLDGRTSGVVYPGRVPALALFLGLRTALADSMLEQVVTALAERLGAPVAKRDVAGHAAVCIDARGLLDEFAPCVVRLPDAGGVAVGFNDATLARALGDLTPEGAPTVKIDFKLMTDDDAHIPGIVAWPFSRVTLTPLERGAALLSVVP